MKDAAEGTIDFLTSQLLACASVIRMSNKGVMRADMVMIHPTVKVVMRPLQPFTLLPQNRTSYGPRTWVIGAVENSGKQLARRTSLFGFLLTVAVV